MENIITQLCGCIDTGTLSKYGKNSRVEDVKKRRGDDGECGTIRDVPLNEYTKTSVNMENAIYVYNQLIAAGFTKQAAAAVMGNLDIENSFSTAWSGDQGSVGIAQWREDRKILLEQFAKQIGGNPTDIKVQVRFLIEKDLPKQLKKEGYEEFKNMTDYIDAADYFCHYVERPARSKDYDAWLNGKYGPNYAQHGGTYMIKWERYEWSEQLQLYELDLKGRRTAAKHWYETMQ